MPTFSELTPELGGVPRTGRRSSDKVAVPRGGTHLAGVQKPASGRRGASKERAHSNVQVTRLVCQSLRHRRCGLTCSSPVPRAHNGLPRDDD